MIASKFEITNTPIVEIKKYLKLGLKKGMYLIEGKVKKGFGTIKGRPKVKSGNLRRSIKSRVMERGNVIEGIVSSKTTYARILEIGGRRPRGGYQKAMPFIRPEMENDHNINSIKAFIVESIVRGNK